MRLWAVVVLVGAVACSHSTDGQALAVQECKDAVTGQLTYDARFPFVDPTPAKDAAGTWHVNGTVTAQNGFGAKRTLRWTCSVNSNGDAHATLSGA